jgi:hypothetical protein
MISNVCGQLYFVTVRKNAGSCFRRVEILSPFRISGEAFLYHWVKIRSSPGDVTLMG